MVKNILGRLRFEFVDLLKEELKGNVDPEYTILGNRPIIWMEETPKRRRGDLIPYGRIVQKRELVDSEEEES